MSVRISANLELWMDSGFKLAEGFEDHIACDNGCIGLFSSGPSDFALFKIGFRDQESAICKTQGRLPIRDCRPPAGCPPEAPEQIHRH